MKNLSSTLNSWPLGFFRLPGQDAHRLIALKAGVFVERGIHRIPRLGLIGGFLIVHVAGHCWAEPDHLAGDLVDQHNILLRMGFLLAAVVLFLLDGVRRALPAAFGAIHGQRGAPFPCQRAGRDLPRVAFWLHPEVGQRVLDGGRGANDASSSLSETDSDRNAGRASFGADWSSERPE